MRRNSQIALVVVFSFVLLNLSVELILNLGLGSLAIAFSGWLLNRHRVSRTA